LPARRHVVDGTECKNGNEEEDEELKRGGDTVGEKVADALEDLSRAKDAVHNGREPRLGEHNVGG